MGGFFSSELKPSSRIEESNSSRVESPRRIHDFIRDRANSSREESHISHRPDACDEEQKKYEQKKLEAIEIGKIKMYKYQLESEIYQEKDKDIFEDFGKVFQNTVHKYKDKFSIQSYNYSLGRYNNTFILDNDNLIIQGDSNTRYKNAEIENNTETKFYCSDVIFNQALLFLNDTGKELSQVNLQNWIGKYILNKKTLDVVELFFPEEERPDGKIEEGSKMFKAGEDGFIALAGTPTAQSKFYLLAQHPKAFPGKEVTSITVIRYSGGLIDIEYEFGSQWEQKEEADPNTSNTVVFGSRDSLE
jgi:hypothetical protein